MYWLNSSNTAQPKESFTIKIMILARVSESSHWSDELFWKFANIVIVSESAGGDWSHVGTANWE